MRFPKFDDTINYGHILTAATVAFGGIGVVTTFMVGQARTDEKVELLAKSRPVIEQSIAKLTEASISHGEQLKTLTQIAGEQKSRTIELRGKVDVVEDAVAEFRGRMNGGVRR